MRSYSAGMVSPIGASQAETTRLAIRAVSGSLNRNRILDCATGLSFALLVSTPSIKLFFSTPILNVLFLGLVLAALMFRRRFCPIRANRINLIIWGVFSIVLLFDLVLAIDSISTGTLIRAIYFILGVAAAFLAFTPGAARWLTFFLLVWGSIVALVQVTVGIDYDRSLGQHYLTVSLPIGIALTGAVVALLAGRIRPHHGVFLLGLCCLCLISLATLYSRSALIYPPVVVGFVLFLSMVSRRAPANIWRQGSRILFLVLISLPFTGAIEFKQLNRLEELSNFEDELRWRIFVQAFKHIKESPIYGHGVDASYALMGIYSHNIFLEVALTGGIFLLAAFLAIMLVYTVSVRSAIVRPEVGSISPMMIGMSLFSLLQWNTSFDLLTAYVPLVLVAATCALALGSKSRINYS